MPPKKVIPRAAANSSLQSAIYNLIDSDEDTKQKKKKMGEKKCEAAWFRIVTALLFMLRTTRQQMVLDYLQKKGNVEETVDVQDKKVKFQTATKKGKGTPIAQGIGAPLARSSTQKYWEKEPEECPHAAEYLRCRSNRFQTWWTCLTCGSRWERTNDTTSGSTSLEVPETPDAKNLKTMVGTYPKYLPAPKSKPQQGAIQLQVDRLGRVGPTPGDTGSTQGPIPKPKHHKPKGLRDRSLSKERQMLGLRPFRPPKRSTLAEGEKETQELVEEKSWDDVEFIPSDQEERDVQQIDVNSS